MMNINPMLLIDFYKAVHAEMLPRGGLLNLFPTLLLE